MNTCVIYTRFSPRPDADEAESCDTQEAQCLAHVEGRGWRVRSMHRDEGLSGKVVDRPGLAAALADLRKGDVLLVVNRDRLARDMFLGELIRRQVAQAGARIHALHGEAVAGDDDSPEAVFVRQVLDAVAELARKQGAARTRHSMRTQQRQGKRMSHHTPYGWQVDPEDPARLVPHEEEQQRVRRVLRLHAEGRTPWQIARELTVKRVPARGKAWTAKTVAKIISRGPAPKVEA